ncbi:MAG: isoprenylcysteine carboxylmethyltransferase family protein [Methylocystis sp.]
MIKCINKAKLYDLAAVTPVVVWLGLGIVGSLLKTKQMIESREEALAICSQITTTLFMSLVIVFIIIRRPPIRKSKGYLPRLAGISGFVLPFFFLALPRANLTRAITDFSSAVVFLGTAALILSVCWLGRSFSILPQARGLVIEGPYRVIRHPLYLAELCVLFGRVWELQLPWPFIVMLIAVGIQILRMHFEEQVLLEAFPSYREYANRTARLIPGIY